MAIELIDTLKPKNGGSFPMVEAADVKMPDGTRLSEYQGLQGEKGEKGDPGEAGYTPVKGVDYWTDGDKAEMVSQVLAALPVAEEASF